MPCGNRPNNTHSVYWYKKVKQEEKEKQDLEYHCPLHDHGEARATSNHRSRNSVSSALPMGISTEQYNSARNSLQSSGGCDLCYERAKTAKSIEEFEETEKYLNTMGRDTIKGADIACFPRPLTPNNTIGDFGLPGAANGSMDQPGSIPDNNNTEGMPSSNKPSSP